MNPFQRRLLWSSSLLTGATGGVYWWMKNLLQPVEPWAAINHPLQPWVLKAHILVAPLMVFAVGLIAAGHVWSGFRQGVRTGRWSGLVAAGIFGPLVASGYLIQAVTHAGWLSAVVWIHLAAGVIYLLGVLAHHRLVRGILHRTKRYPRATTRTEAPRRAAPPKATREEPLRVVGARRS